LAIFLADKVEHLIKLVLGILCAIVNLLVINQKYS